MSVSPRTVPVCRARTTLRRGIEGLVLAAAIGAAGPSLAQPTGAATELDPSTGRSETSSTQEIVSPLTPPKSGVYEISIRNTGSANEAAKGTEVWLQYTVGETTGFPGELFKQSEGWTDRDGFFVSSGPGGALNFSGELNGIAGLVFFRHPWSGQVAVTVNGVTQTIDLYAPASDTVTVPLNGDPIVPGRPVESPPSPPKTAASAAELEQSTQDAKPEVVGTTDDASNVWSWAWMPLLAVGILIVIGGGFFLVRRSKM